MASSPGAESTDRDATAHHASAKIPHPDETPTAVVPGCDHLRAVTTLNVLIPTVGSAGDVHPMIALGLALQARGHRATILTNDYFEELIEKCGLGFIAVGSAEQARAAIADPNLWHPIKG